MLQRLKSWARSIKRDMLALWLAARDPRTPWLAKAVAAIVVAYALSPIDLIPDFIPVLGYLDDLVLLPLGMMAAVALIPSDLMAEYRAGAERISRLPPSRGAAVLICLVWALAVLAAAWLAKDWFGV